MHDFWYDCVKPKYDKNAKLCYIDTESFIVYVKTNDIFKDIAQDVETRFDTSNFEVDRPLPKAKMKYVIGLMTDELDGKIMKKIVGLTAKPYSLLKDNNNDEDKKAKGTKSVSSRENLNFNITKKVSKTNSYLNLINYETEIDKIYLYAKDPYEAKYQLLIKNR